MGVGSQGWVGVVLQASVRRCAANIALLLPCYCLADLSHAPQQAAKWLIPVSSTYVNQFIGFHRESARELERGGLALYCRLVCGSKHPISVLSGR